MVITIYTAELVKRMKAVSHREVAEIADTEARYRAEAGTEKAGIIRLCISDAHARLKSRVLRFLEGSYTAASDNDLEIPTEYVYELIVSERRGVNKAEPLQAAMSDFAVEYALSKFYSTVSQTELSNKHSLLAIDAGNLIEQLLYYKQPPRV